MKQILGVIDKSFMALSQDIQKTIKKTARREQLMREEAEQKRLKTVLELQYVLDKLGDDEVRTDLTHNHQNGLCEEEEAASAPTIEDQVAEAEPEPAEDYTEQNEVESTEYVNRQFMAETQFTSGEKELASSPSVPRPDSLTPVAQADPLLRRQRVQDLMAQMQGPYNFVQDSVLDFENQTLDPAIVSAQPVNPAQNMDMPQLVCPPVHSESKLVQPYQVPVHNQKLHRFLWSHPQPQVFQAGTSKPLHSGGINVNAAPFQSMQMVFSMNAPVPPVNEPETLKQQNQYQASYNQSFSSQSHQVEQTELHQEQLQTVVGIDHGSPDQSHQVTGNHPQPPQQNTGFPPSSQPYTIAVVRLVEVPVVLEA
ncbi:Caprin-1 [Saguinus oedipus]|uniref:Caprin-1 n=1 Tax=Saguinus oedipus TaxID=9490 RepID=A0ABQ9TL30_SAGOE|nr:Caprin-1 [Saguinus oedipus]